LAEQFLAASGGADFVRAVVGVEHPPQLVQRPRRERVAGAQQQPSVRPRQVALAAAPAQLLAGDALTPLVTT